jgi:hypothetical protein
MPEIVIDLEESTLKRLHEIAEANARSIRDVVGHFLRHSIEGYDMAKTPEEIEKHVESFRPTLPRPVIDRERIQAMVDKYKGTQGPDK